ncbi:MAG: dockerin type I domain-containing protein, partial [Candidatus Acetothermia bacterium]
EEDEPREEEKAEGDGEEPTDGERDYQLKLNGFKLRLGGEKKVTLSLSSLPDGFRLAEATVISEGVTVDDVTGEESIYYEVVENSRDSIYFRVGDFDGEVGPDTSEFTLAELHLEALRAGWGSLKVRTYIWTDDGEEVVRTFELSDIKVYRPAILGTDNPPQDLNGDGLYEDVNGDGELTKKDVFVLAVNLGKSGGIDAPMFEVFDFNEDGVVNFDDAAELMKLVEEN